MKTIIVLCAASLLTGCATRDYSSRGMAPRRSGFETGERMDPELPYRTGPGLNSTDREVPPRSGPGGLGR